MKFIFTICLKILSFFVKTQKKHMYFIPHRNNQFDKMDIINYSSDNVLMLLNYIIKQAEQLKGYTIYVEIYDESRLNQYTDYVKNIKGLRFHFLAAHIGVPFKFSPKPLKYIIKGYFYFLSSSKVFTATFYFNFTFKKKAQTIICLGYYSPFKDDYHSNGNSYYEHIRNIAKESFDYYVSTSELNSRIISVDSGIPYNRFKNLGFPRNDTFGNPKHIDKIRKYIEEKSPYSPKKVIIYTPTFREYQENQEKKKDINILSALGYTDCDIKKLSDILIKHQAVIILKLHPLKRDELIKTEIPQGFILIEPSYDFSLYDLMPLTDAMITDYTSTYFDYLLLNKPVIFNFGDIDKYKQVRGFSYNPIESMCCGHIAYNYDEFLTAIKSVLQNENTNCNTEKRITINSLINKHSDFNSTERVFQEFIIKEQSLITK